MSPIPYDLRTIKAFVFDVDGVLSNETIPLDPNGDPTRTTNVKDGFAFQRAIQLGFPIAIISGGYAESLQLRFAKLGITHIFLQSASKRRDFDRFLELTGLAPEQIAYAGDDIPDREIMSIVGLSVAPADAVPEILQIARYVSPCKGGQGVARDLIEQTLKAQGLWLPNSL